jgi:hypothetical protein
VYFLAISPKKMLTKRSPEVSAVSTVADQRLLHLLCNDRDLRARTVHDLVDSSFHALEVAKREGYKLLCPCTDPPQRMVLRKTMESYVIAVWPNQGHMHHPSCHFYRDEDDNTAIKPDEPDETGAIEENEHGFDVRLSLSLLQSARKAAESREHNATPARQAATAGLTELFHHLYRQASLNMHRPDARYRDWSFVRWALGQQVELLRVNGREFNKHTYIVPVFNVKTKTSPEPWPPQRIRSLAQSGYLFLIGEVKSIEPGGSGCTWWLKNFPRPLLADPSTQAGVLKDNTVAGTSIDLLKHSPFKHHILLLARIRLGAETIHLMNASLLLTAEQYIPVDNMAELELATALVREKRAFIKPMVGSTIRQADFLLRDTNPHTALFVLPANTAIRDHKINASDWHAQAKQRAIWIWDKAKDQERPALPTASQTPGN